jgi:hypothetical protein
MSEAKPFASLSPSLLARKGAARPAMRPQLQPLTFEEQNRLLFGSQPHPVDAETDFNGHDDLGWNDMGDDVAPVDEAGIPEVLRQIESLAGSMTATPEAPVAKSASKRTGRGKVAKLPVVAPVAVASRQSALSVGRKAAFTLRVDAHRHLRLRLACTLENRSAQSVVTDALDQFLDSMPGLDELARRARRP